MDVYKHCLFVVLLIATSSYVVAQNLSNNNDANLYRLYDLQDYYLAQIKKDYISDTLKYGYRLKLADIEKEIKVQYDDNLKRIQNAPNSNQLIQEEKKKQDYRVVDLEMKEEADPIVYANEINSWNIYGGIGFGGIHYSMPVSLGVERVFSEKISGGILVQRLAENIKVKEYDDSLTSYTVYTSSYKYYYTSFNAKLSYHITIPSVDFEYFDFYASAIVGYNLTAKSQNSVEPDAVANASRAGINFGVMGGVKYMLDENFGLYAELGYSRNNYFSVGMVYRIVPPATKKVKLTEEELLQKEIEETEKKLQKKIENAEEDSSPKKEKAKKGKGSDKETDKEEDPINDIPNPENKPEETPKE